MAGSRILKLAIVIYTLVSPATAQIADSTESFLEGQIAGFIDSLVVAEISSAYDIVLFIIIPFLGLYGITLYLTRKSFQMAEDNFSNSTYGSSDLSDQAKKSTQLIAVAISAVTVSQFGGVTPLIALILGLIGGIFIIWQFWGAFQTTRHRGDGGTTTTTTTPDTGGGPQGGEGPSRGEPDRGSPDRGGPERPDDTGGGPQSGEGPEGGGVPGGGQMGPHMAQMMQMQGMNMNQGMMEFMRLLQGDFRRGPNGNINVGGNQTVSQEAFEEFRQAMHNAGGTIGQSTMMDIIELLQQRGAGGLTDELLEEIAQIIMDPETEEEVDVNINEAVARVMLAEIRQAVESGNLEERDCVDQFVYLLEGEIFPAPGNSVNLVTEGSTPNTHLKTETVKTFFQEINSLSEQQAKTAGKNVIEELASGPEELNEEFLEHIVSSLGDWLNQGNKNRDNNNGGMADDLSDIESRVLQQDMEDINQLHKLVTSLIQEDKRVLQELARMDAELEVADKLFGRAQEHFLGGSPDPTQGAVEVAEAEMILHHFEAEFADVKKMIEDERNSLEKVEKVEEEVENLQNKLDTAMNQLATDHGLSNRSQLVTQAIKNNSTDLDKKPSNFNEGDIKRLVKKYASQSTKDRLTGWL